MLALPAASASWFSGGIAKLLICWSRGSFWG